jgi:hypothetical protein
LRGDTFASAGKAKFLRRRRFDADSPHVEIENLCDPGPHRFAVRPHFGRFANQSHVAVRDNAAFVADEIACMR